MLTRPLRDSRSYRLATVLLVALLAVVVFANSWGVFHTDIKPEVYLAPGAMIHDYLSAWTFSPYLGGPNFNAGLAPVVLVVGALRWIGLSPEIAFKVFHLVLWIVAAWGMVRLARRLDPRISREVSLIAAIVYVANPYAVSAGATLAILLPMAWLPWQIYCLIRAFEEPRSWRWPALFGLTFFLMSGMQVAVVPVFGLLAVIPVAVYARRRFQVSWSATFVIVTRCAVFVVWLSSYWLVSALSATETGSSIVESSETFDGIARVSSFAEVMRGLGLWPLYGAGWIPEHAMYLDNMFVVLATFIATAAAILAFAYVPRRLGKLLVSLAALAAVVMVGVHPPESPSPFGRVLLWLFESVPVLSAFRTTNKIGAILVLALALAVAVGVGSALRTNRGFTRKRGTVMVVGGVLMVLISLPAWIGQLYTSPLQIPGYWKEASGVINSGPSDERVLALPGQVRAKYRWTAERPDDIFNSLLTRQVLVPVTTPNTSPTAFNFSTALDDTFQSGTSSDDTTSVFARYLGVGQLLLRHDTKWEDDGGARPSETQATVNRDRGLLPLRNFGNPGENVGSPTIPASGFAETDVPPLQLYGIKGAQPVVRTETQDDSVFVAGDGWSVPSMTRAGLLEDVPSFRYAHDVPGKEFSSFLGPTHRVVLTDTNRRRDTITNRLTAGQGPLLRAEDTLSDTSRSLGKDSEDQTVLDVDGGTVTATQSGFAFYDIPWSVPENAFDNDPETAWIFGDFKSGVGEQLKIEFDAPRQIRTVKIQQRNLGTVRIGDVTVSAGAEDRKTRFGADGTATVDFDGVTANSLSLKIEDLEGDGYNAVGISDVSIPGVNISRIARTPNSIMGRYQTLSESERLAFADTPFDVLLTRVQGSASPGDDEEVNLERNFSTPDKRRFTARAVVRVDRNREDLYDRLAGIRLGAASSGNYYDNPDLRASRAFDGDRETAWIPRDDVKGSWIENKGPSRQLPSLTFEQKKIPDAVKTNWAARISVVADGKSLATANVKPGENKIDLTDEGIAPTVKTVRVVVTKDAGIVGASPPRIVEIGAGHTLKPNENASTCLPVATIDGAPLSMRPSGNANPARGEWKSCNNSLPLESGVHRLRSVDPSITIDSLDLLDVQKNSGSPQSKAPSTDVKSGFGAGMTVNTAANPGGKPYYLVIGQGFDPRWRAVANGRDLGAPISLDGYSTAWRIDSAFEQTIKIQYGPQRGTNIAIILTLVGLSLVGLLLVLPTVRRRFGPFAWLPLGRLRKANKPRVAAASTTSSMSGISDRLGRLFDRRQRLPQLVRSAGGWTLFTLGAWFFASWPGLLAGVVLGLWHLVRPPSSLTLIRVGAGLFVAAGLLFIGGMGDLRGTVSTKLITENPWPNVAAAGGLIFAVVGVWRRGGDGTESEEAAFDG